jgi:hypothetical protein
MRQRAQKDGPNILSGLISHSSSRFFCSLPKDNAEQITIMNSAPTMSSPITRATEDFRNSSNKLRKAIGKAMKKRMLTSITIPDFEQVSSIEAKANELDGLIELYLSSRRNHEPNRKRIETVKKVSKSWFKATYPFTRIFLQIGITGSAVSPFRQD